MDGGTPAATHIDGWAEQPRTTTRAGDGDARPASSHHASNGAGDHDAEAPSARPTAGRAARRSARKIRYTDAEWVAIVERARECRKAPARYVREVSLGAVPKARRSAANAALVRELGRIGNSIAGLSRIARKSPEQDDIAQLSAALDASLQELLAAVRRID